MALKEVNKEMGVVQEEGEEKWLKYYSSNHQILLVGEGDFSFALCLVQSFGSGTNICASSLDTYDEVIKKYKKAKFNLVSLVKLGASVLHGVDATKMKIYCDLKMRKFDRIIFNFPHAGFHGKEDNALLIGMHKDLVNGFFRNASNMLRANGEIHVSHKKKAPFCYWDLEKLARRNSLALIECVDFKMEDYPGYNNKRGDGLRCDEPFRLGECSTFKFRLALVAKKMSRMKMHLDFTHRRHQQLQEIPIGMQQQPTSLGLRHPQINFTIDMNDFPRHVESPLTINIRRGSPWIPNGCFNHVTCFNGRNGNDVDCLGNEAPGRTLDHVDYFGNVAHRLDFRRYMAGASGRTLDHVDYFGNEARQLDFRRSMAEAPGRTLDHVDYFGNEALQLEFRRDMTEAPGGTLNGFMYLMGESHRLRSLRSARLQRMSLRYDQYQRF